MTLTNSSPNTGLTSALLDLCKKEQTYTKTIRKELHQIPELSWEEEKTIRFIKKEILDLLENSNIHHKITEEKGGLIVDLLFNPSYQMILFRADIDALAIQEETSLSYSSKHPGKMHACGHDMHASMLLGFLSLLSKNQSFKPNCNLRLVWQRAEEYLYGESGGKSLVNSGICQGVEKVYALHIGSTYENGSFLSRPGKYLASPTALEFEIKSRGGHVRSPNLGSNAIDIFTDIHTRLRNFIQTHIKPSENATLVPSLLNFGTAFNIIPNSGKVTYSFRSFLNEEELNTTLSQLKELIESVVSTYKDAHLENFKIYRGFPTLINDDDEFNRIKDLFESENQIVKIAPQSFAGDDFSYYANEKKGSYWVLGAKQNNWDHHTSKFSPDDSILYKGVYFWALLSLYSMGSS